MSEKKLSILALGLETPVTDYLGKAIPYMQMQSDAIDFKYFEECVSPMPAAILCGEPPADLPSNEVAQGLRMLYPDTPIYFISTNRAIFNRKQLQKNGFTEAYLLPVDNQTVVRALEKIFALQGEQKVYRTIRLMDVPSDNTLGFDLYVHLPANNKYVKYAGAAEALDEKRSQRLKKYDVKSAAVTEDQLSKFYDFSAAQLKKLNSDTTMSETERRERREGAVRDLFTGIFGDGGKDDTLAQGRGVMQDCQEIIKSYVVSEGDSSMPWFEKIMDMSNSEGGSYNHSANVSTYSALFAIALGIGKPDELALAGLLHDIGLADIPQEIAGKDPSERTPEEEVIYQRHPVLSVNMLKEKKMSISEKIAKIILQHHERFDGKGYPNAVIGERVLKEAQLLGIADLFDYLTQAKAGRARVTPIEAMQSILEANSKEAGVCQFDPKILQQLMGLFQNQAVAA